MIASTSGLAVQVKKDLGLRVFHEIIRNFPEKNKYSSREARKKNLLSAQNAENTLQFATEHVSLPPEDWDDVILSYETKIMLYYHDGSQRVWSKPLRSALKSKILILTVKFGKLSIMEWICISNKGVDVTRILDEIITRKVYFDVLNNVLIPRFKKFVFIDPVNPNN